MKKLLSALAFMLMSSTGFAQSTPHLEGVYDCSSVEIGTHVVYKGTTTLTKTNQTYAVNAEFNDGSAYSGVAIYDTKQRVLSVAFVNPKDASETGVAAAHVMNQHVLKSTWTYINQKETGTSTCIKRA